MMVNQNRLEEIKKQALNNNVPIVQDEALVLIETILTLLKPNKILEIGTAVGYSAICFSKYLKDNKSKIYSVELNEEKIVTAKNNIGYVLDNPNCIELTNMDAFEYMKSLNETFDFVFIDAAKGQYIKYLEQALRLTHSGSVIIADNILFKGRVLSEYNEHKHRTAVNRLREYIQLVKTDANLISSIVDISDGLAISVVK